MDVLRDRLVDKTKRKNETGYTLLHFLLLFSRGLSLDDCLSFFECQWDVDPAYLVSTLHLKIKVKGKDI